MLKDISVNLGNFLLSLADAVDMSSPLTTSHQLRTAFIAWRICEVGNVAKPTTERIFIAALLHDIGALTPEDKIRIHRFDETNIEDHCRIGELLLKSCPLLAPSAPAVRHHHRLWEDWETALETPHVFEAQVIQLADVVEKLIKRDRFILHQVDELKAGIAGYAGQKINRKLLKLFEDLAAREDFWLDLMSPRLYSLLLHHGPLNRYAIDYGEAHNLTRLFRNIIDLRSRFTAAHSAGVVECATRLSRLFGMTEWEIRQMEMAGNLHDLGMLAVPGEILDKPGRLTADEYALIKQHPYFTYTVLNSIGGMEQVAEWAALHHEMLDGSGYPFHAQADRLSTGARILAVADVFTALTGDRAHRKSMDKGEVVKILLGRVKERQLPGNIINLLCDNYAELAGAVAEEQARVLKRYLENLPRLGAGDSAR
jgi:HD-GYP domain-containing protein (c-di-GMP phosphodiesterase class II)